MRNALGLLKLLAQGEEDIRKGNIRPQEEVFSDLERLLRESASCALATVCFDSFSRNHFYQPLFVYQFT